MTRRFRLLASAALLGAGLVLSGCNTVPDEGLQLVATSQATSKINARVGKVYLLRGWLGVFSSGMDELAHTFRARGINAEVYSHTAWSALADAIIDDYNRSTRREPIILIGHSYGADDIIPLARRLGQAGVPVDLLMPLDAVLPRAIPANVRRVVNIYQSNPVMDGLPFLRGLPVSPGQGFRGTIINADARSNRRDLNDPELNHFTIDKSKPIQAEVIKEVMKIAVARKGWRAPHVRHAKNHRNTADRNQFVIRDDE